jgi:IclR family transcriptional regulator, KDG regulon repressor
MLLETYNPKYPVQTLEKALEVIELLALGRGQGLGITELSRALGMGKSTVHRILDTLVARGYVDKDEVKSSYRLTWKIYELGNSVPYQRNFGNLDMEILNELCNRFQESVNLGVRSDNDVVIIAMAQPQTALKVNKLIGDREPLHATALGKVLISELDPIEIRNLFESKELESCTPMTITDINTLMVELQKVREQGFAVDNQEYNLGLTCIAMPIRDFNHKIIAALSISGPSFRVDLRKILEVTQELSLASKKLSEFMGDVAEEGR